MDSSTHSTLSSGSRHRTDDLNNLNQLIEAAQINPDAEERLRKRKKWELKLIRKYEKTSIKPPNECWFLMDSQWLNSWHQFVAGDLDEEPPGPVSTMDLLDENKVPLKNLRAKIDYRGVSPMCYAVFVELYGKNRSPELCRYEVDIYKPEVPLERVAKIKRPSVIQAKVDVNRARPKWMNWEVEFEEDEVEPDCWCCGLTKEHLESFMYWMIYCWARKSSGRSDIKYSAYQPLRGLPDDSNHSQRLNDSSNHSVRSTGSNTSQRSTGSNSSRGMIRNQAHSYESDSSDSDDGGLRMAPADRDHERGLWLSSFYSGGSTHGRSSHGSSSAGVVTEAPGNDSATMNPLAAAAAPPAGPSSSDAK